MIYLDNNATTRVLPEVLDAMIPFYRELWGNPSSLHPFGAQLGKFIEEAREQAANLIGAQRASEVIFTSGGTESNHLAILGLLQANPLKRHIVTSSVEHPSVLMLCKRLEKEGFSVTYLTVSKNGSLDLKELENAVREDTSLVSLMWANNETGVIFPIEEIAKTCLKKNVSLHVDAIQAAGKIPIDLAKTPVSLLSISGHKIHAPKGIGALYIRRGTKLKSLFTGGHQERGFRAGTENVAHIVGLGVASRLAKQRLKENILEKVGHLRDSFEQEIIQKFSWVKRNGEGSKRLPNTSSLSFEGMDGETLCLLLGEEGIACSTGSACTAGSLESSHVLKSMGLGQKEARGTIRFSLSFENKDEAIEEALIKLEKIVLRLKTL